MRTLILFVLLAMASLSTPATAEAVEAYPAWFTSNWTLPVPDFSDAVFVAIAETKSRLVTRLLSERQSDAAECMESIPVEYALYQALQTYQAMGNPAWLRHQPVAVLVAFSLRVNCAAVES